jgi:hypothetical protein
MKAKQNVDVTAADALEHAVADFAKMYIKEWILAPNHHNTRQSRL